MRVYKVIIDIDGSTKKGDGKTETEIIRTEEFYASDTVGGVFNAAIQSAACSNGEIIAVVEVCPSITIL